MVKCLLNVSFHSLHVITTHEDFLQFILPSVVLFAKLSVLVDMALVVCYSAKSYQLHGCHLQDFLHS